jgi:hypothetical protein
VNSSYEPSGSAARLIADSSNIREMIRRKSEKEKRERKEEGSNKERNQYKLKIQEEK